MSAAAPVPEPTGLSAEQRRVLDELAAHENAADPGYVLRMNAPARPEPSGAAGAARAEARETTVARGRRRDLVVQLSVVGVILALVLPVAWTVALVLTVVLLVGPVYLVTRALREGGLGPPATRPDRPDPDRP